jgi:hypothetical protein
VSGFMNGFIQVTILNAGSVIGRLLPNFFADRFGVYNMLLPCLYISSALVFAILAVTNLVGVVVFGLLYGFWSGSCEFLVIFLRPACSWPPRRVFDPFVISSTQHRSWRVWVIMPSFSLTLP